MSSSFGERSPAWETVSHELARFVAACRYEEIPTEVRHEAQRSLLNFFAVALAGCTDPTIQKAASVLERFSAGALATVVGRPQRTDMLNAATLNAMSANVFDFDDTHVRTVIHPTAPVAPTLWALAEHSRVSGTALLHAFILGVEIECRLGNAISPAHYARGWHITSTCGVFGAAVGAGKLLRLGAESLVWALGAASAQSSGLVETLGTMAKSVGVGNAARNGLLSALLAEEGFNGPAQPLEGTYGFLNVAGERPDFSCVADGLGEHWEILGNTYKPYPCGVVLNPVVEACLDLSACLQLEPENVAQVDLIEITGHPLLRQRTDRPSVRTGRESQVSAQHAVAVALIRGRAGLDEFSDEAVSDPLLQALGAKVRFRDDPGRVIDAAEVTVQRRGMAPISVSVDAARGGLSRPLADQEIEDKLRRSCAFGRSGCDPEPLISALWALDREADAGTLMRLAVGR